MSSSMILLPIGLILYFSITSVKSAPSNYKSLDPEYIFCDGKPADIFFLLDSSSSIWSVDYKLQLQFLQDLVDSFPISQTEVRIGVGIFSHRYRTQFNFNVYDDKERLKYAISRIPQLYGNTKTGRALKNVRLHALRRARPNVAKIVIVLTDGESRDKHETIKQSRLLKEQGVDVFAIGIGKGPNVDELHAIASEPSDDFVFTVVGFDVLDTIRDSLAYKACRVPKDMPYCSAYLETDVMFVHDAAAMGTTNSNHVVRFSTDVINQFGNMEDGTVRAGLLSGDCHTNNFNLNAFETKQGIVNTLKQTQPIGLDSILNDLHCNGFNESRGGRNDARHIAIVFIDKSIDKFDSVIKEVLDSKQKGIEVFVVGIGGDLDQDFLEELASAPSEQHIFIVDNHSQLDAYSDQFSQLFCNHLERE